MEIFILSLLSYLLGSIPFGFLLTKIFLKKDIREIGSGNIGATNTLRTGNKVLGYSLAVSGTPSYFIGGVNIRGAAGYETLQEVVDYTSEYQRIDDYIIKEAESGNEEAYRVMLRYGLY